MQTQMQTTFIRRTQTQERQDTQAKSRTVKVFSKMADESEVYFSWFSYKKKTYLFNVTENVRYNCKQFEIHFSIKSECICCMFIVLS